MAIGIIVASGPAYASDRSFDQLATVSYVLSTALIGPIQGLLTSNAPPAAVEAVRTQLSAMLGAYLAAIGSPRVC